MVGINSNREGNSQVDIKTPEGRREFYKSMKNNLVDSSASIFASFHQQIIKSEHGFFSLIDSSGVIQQVSPDFHKLLGLPPDSLIGKNIRDLTDPLEVDKTLSEALQEGMVIKKITLGNSYFVALVWNIPNTNLFGEYLIEI